MRRSTIRLATAFAGLLLPGFAHAQATAATATEAIHLNVFGVGSYDRPDFGVYRGAGGFAVGGGAGFSVPHLHGLEPALDVRYTYGTNQAATQTTFSGGLRIIYHLARFQPYGDLMVGEGTIHFKQLNPAFPNYTHDNSVVYTYGGGVDLDVTRTVAMRFDLQEQHWRFSEISPPFHPVQASVGIRYQFHFHNQHGMD